MRSSDASAPAAFERSGLIRWPGLVPEELVKPVREALWRRLEEAGAMRHGHWTEARGENPHLQVRLLRELNEERNTEAYAELLGAQVTDRCLKVVADESLTPQAQRAQLLFTPPNARSWAPPAKLWHLDVPRLGALGCPGVQVFVFVDRVEPCGGGTLVVAGSHRLVNDVGFLRSKEVVTRLREESPWFQELFSADEDRRRRLLETPSTGDDLQLIELVGEPGDAWLMDLRVLHSLGPNASDRARLMVTQRYLREGAKRQLARR